MRGAAGLRMHDRLHGTHYWDMIKDGYYRGMEQEFVRPDGTLNFYRSARTGIGLAGTSFSTDLRPTLPHIADRAWTLLRAAYGERDGKLVTPLAGRDKLLDTGNYSFHPLKAYAYIIEEAREVGDDEAADAAWDEVQQRIDMTIDDRGWLVVEGASVAAHLALARSLNGRKSGWLDLISRGMPDAWVNGPQVESVPYPAVMVSRAVKDGEALDAVFRSTNGGGRFDIELSQLRPHAEYDLTGATAASLVADERGRADGRGGAQRAAGAAARAAGLRADRCRIAAALRQAPHERPLDLDVDPDVGAAVGRRPAPARARPPDGQGPGSACRPSSTSTSGVRRGWRPRRAAGSRRSTSTASPMGSRRARPHADPGPRPRAVGSRRGDRLRDRAAAPDRGGPPRRSRRPDGGDLATRFAQANVGAALAALANGMPTDAAGPTQPSIALFEHMAERDDGLAVLLRSHRTVNAELWQAWAAFSDERVRDRRLHRARALALDPAARGVRRQRLRAPDRRVAGGAAPAAARRAASPSSSSCAGPSSGASPVAEAALAELGYPRRRVPRRRDAPAVRRPRPARRPGAPAGADLRRADARRSRKRAG